ncbi:NADPH-dependent oxidoreductase [Erwinia persicina]|uniref:NADPH-dependent oxidoreductase n=1 Tax=Erwinia persicina TaxID=55211 RepID=A0A3S7S2B3_9GAMM|nr:NADPH-dependent oxidoreductase [Erwinia persicina]AXU94860.1 NADPH-dependent oxidoreductase [Erwinia persicina]MBC3947243.1 NADPH-dependent oxidoreductase [Erwinia persicina]MBD8107953.1 NADPH-dependent oxidoreductase [Erwinia persicina]MBD8167081.1 NADPH-dependent oxidoreductase [Erwinia persicina]MBD8211033.1 NADPH-dependent oxidoreductase [Erwinia persicina]
MNEVTQLLKSHRSDRSYLDKPIDDAVLDDIIETAWRAPTSVNSQQVSLVVVRDAATRARIAEIAGGQPWIAQAPVFITFVLDMHKSQLGIEAEGKSQIAHESLESLISGATDIGIALGAVMTAARSHGLGVVPIGGIRRQPQAMVELLNLPELTFPVAGVVLGYIDQPAVQKPRMSLAGFRHNERYDAAILPDVIKAYNRVLVAHWQSTGREDGDNWGNNTASYYQNIYFPDVQPAILQQGFGIDK